VSHVVNANKMVSDTPRTDAEAFWPHDSQYKVCDAVFARQLERELNAANSKIELLMSANADVARIAEERDAAENRIPLLIAERDTARLQADQQYKLREEFADLLGTDDVEQGVAAVREMKERIKRLEEVGDKLYSAIYCGCLMDGPCKACSDAADMWDEIKEAKP
jgi:hypothetical protein